jgi:hypothetical protein
MSESRPRQWTATEVHKLKGLAKRDEALAKIARVLRRTSSATLAKAQSLGFFLAAPVDECAQGHPATSGLQPSDPSNSGHNSVSEN